MCIKDHSIVQYCKLMVISRILASLSSHPERYRPFMVHVQAVLCVFPQPLRTGEWGNTLHSRQVRLLRPEESRVPFYREEPAICANRTRLPIAMVKAIHMVMVPARGIFVPYHTKWRWICMFNYVHIYIYIFNIHSLYIFTIYIYIQYIYIYVYLFTIYIYIQITV